MKFRLGPIPENHEFSPAQSGWRALREPNPVVFQLVALPIGLLATAAVVSGWWLSVAYGLRIPGSSLGMGVLLPILLTVPVHEMVHTLFHPQLGRSAASILGFWPKTMLFYAHYDDALTRTRFIAALMAPFMALSVAPVVGCWLTGYGRWWIVALSAFNAFIACGDLTGVLLVVAQVPSRAAVRNRGYYTWWKDVPHLSSTSVAAAGGDAA
jgi:hypothetical protein